MLHNAKLLVVGPTTTIFLTFSLYPLPSLSLSAPSRRTETARWTGNFAALRPTAVHAPLPHHRWHRSPSPLSAAPFSLNTCATFRSIAGHTPLSHHRQCCFPSLSAPPSPFLVGVAEEIRPLILLAGSGGSPERWQLNDDGGCSTMPTAGTATAVARWWRWGRFNDGSGGSTTAATAQRRRRRRKFRRAPAPTGAWAWPPNAVSFVTECLPPDNPWRGLCVQSTAWVLLH